MSQSICPVDDCTIPLRYGYKLCHVHFYRWKKFGSMDLPPKPTLEERFWAKVSKGDDCWTWTGATNAQGYGQLALSDGAGKIPAHRLSFELANGPIDDGLTVDHICRNTSCVNPQHLRTATYKQNNENKGIAKNNTSGARGVSFDKRNGRWFAQVKHNGLNHWGGYHVTVDEAREAASALRLKLFTHSIED